jgi:3',5'-cyclic AMP phosphodiesterase CpdA
MEFIHISDLHINDNEDHNKKVYTKLINMHTAYPNAIYIITGDITDNGNVKEYIIANKIFNFIKNKILIVAGNHDYGTLGNFYQSEHEKNYRDYCSKYKMHLINDNEKILIMGLDSNLRTIDPFDFACGEIGETQLIFLNDYINNEKYKDYKKVVYLHHHPFMHTDPTMKLYDSNALMPMVAKNINALLFGHKHEQNLWTGDINEDGSYSNYGINVIHSAGKITKETKYLYLNITKDIFEFKYIEVLI